MTSVCLVIITTYKACFDVEVYRIIWIININIDLELCKEVTLFVPYVFRDSRSIHSLFIIGEFNRVGQESPSLIAYLPPSQTLLETQQQ